jgi:hypothetical protein
MNVINNLSSRLAVVSALLRKGSVTAASSTDKVKTAAKVQLSWGSAMRR